jgi:hypothetical protein
MRRAVWRRVVWAGGKVVECKASGVLGPDDLEPTLHKYGKEGWELVQLTPSGHLILRK